MIKGVHWCFSTFEVLNVKFKLLVKMLACKTVPLFETAGWGEGRGT